MLTDLYSFVVSAPTGGLSSDRAAALATLRAAIASRMFPDTLAEGCTLPALSYSLIDSGVGHTLDGANDGLYHPRVQIDVWAMTGVERDSLAAALKTALDGYTQSFMVGTFVNVLEWDNEIDSFEPDRKQYRRMLDFKVVHN